MIPFKIKEYGRVTLEQLLVNCRVVTSAKYTRVNIQWNIIMASE
jgi:hypothetical protein